MNDCRETAGPTDGLPSRLLVVDSHTIGEPTRIVIDPAWLAECDLGQGSIAVRRRVFRKRFDALRRGIVADPRGTEAMVGMVLLPSSEPSCAMAAIYFNEVGYLDMCGHATIGLAVTLGHLGRIVPGTFRLETPAGIVTVTWHGGNDASFENVPPRRIARGLAVECADGRRVTGDISTAGLWFFLTSDHGESLLAKEIPRLTARAWSIRRALMSRGISGDAGQAIDHIVLLGKPESPKNNGRAFVLCPDGAFDRSPCGTATSAIVASLYADGFLAAEKVWRQESILGGVYEASVRCEEGMVVPSVRGSAWITAESTLFFNNSDPYRAGLPHIE